MTDAEMIIEAINGIGGQIDVAGIIAAVQQLSDKVEVVNALLAGVIVFLGMIAGMVFLRELWRCLE